MKEYEFKVYIPGQGETPEQAWEEAVDHILENISDFAKGGVPDYTTDGTKVNKLWTVTDLEGDGCSGPIHLGTFQATDAEAVEKHIRLTHDLPTEIDFKTYYSVEEVVPIEVAS